MITRNFWPLDFDPEGEIYENPSWDLPGLRPGSRSSRTHRPPARSARRPPSRSDNVRTRTST